MVWVSRVCQSDVASQTPLDCSQNIINRDWNLFRDITSETGLYHVSVPSTCELKPFWTKPILRYRPIICSISFLWVFMDIPFFENCTDWCYQPEPGSFPLSQTSESTPVVCGGRGHRDILTRKISTRTDEILFQLVILVTGNGLGMWIHCSCIMEAFGYFTLLLHFTDI